MEIRVVGYVRVSTDQQAEAGVSLEAQRAKLAAYALAMDLNMVSVMEDGGFSAKSMDRPGLQRALGTLQRGDAEGLLITKLDRLTRSMRDLTRLVEEFFATKFSLFSVADSIDTRTAAGRLVLNVLGSVGQWERETIGERTREALGHLKASGVRLGRESLGWRRDSRTDADGRRVVVSLLDEEETVAMIHALREEGYSLRAICAALERAGRRTKRNGRWSPKVVRAVLKRSAQL